MTLDEAECWARLATARHAVLATVHPRRGVDAVPVVFALVGSQIVLPVDTVKAKRHTRLQRLTNLQQDSRCVLLVEQYRDDWSQAWWVRVHAGGAEAEASPELIGLLAARYPQYGTPGTVVGLILLTPTEVTGWAAGPPAAPATNR